MHANISLYDLTENTEEFYSTKKKNLDDEMGVFFF